MRPYYTAIVLLYLCLCVIETNAQISKLFGLYFNSSTSEQILTSLDLQSDTYTDIATVPGFTATSFGESTFDINGERLFVIANSDLTIISSTSGAVLNTIASTNNIRGIEYDQTSDKIYATYWNGSQQILTSLDLTTNAFTDIGVLTGVATLNIGESTFDSANGRYFMITNLGIIGIDVSTGNIVHTIPTSLIIRGLEYDPNSGNLYGSYWNGSEQIFVSVDLSSNTVSDVQTLTGVSTLTGGESSLDEVNGRYFMLTNLGITIIDPSTGNISNTVANSNNIFRIEYGLLMPLPVELSFFNVSPQGEQVHIEWETHTEVNSSHFIVEKSYDGEDWMDLETVVASGNSEVSSFYQMIDADPFLGTSYYRLKSIDLDGTHEYSNIQSIELRSLERTQNARVYPNPTKDRIIFLQDNSFHEKETNWNVYDINGKSVQNWISVISTRETEIQLDVSQLSNGMYLLRSENQSILFFKN